ncbi:hypothetical protein C2E44_08570 [Enterobacter ludwigii]|nr:hypothetical protein C2E44_08570 [Enterobacter ludwigii]
MNKQGCLAFRTPEQCHETRRRDRFLDPDANVLFYLNLPPKPAINHKVKLVITLAYDLKTRKSLQSYSLANCD